MPEPEGRIMDNILKTDGIIRSFHSGRETVHALKSVSIYVEQGKLTLLRGRSGSGKTTLMNMLGALDRPNAGQIWFRGKDIASAGETFRNEMRRKNIGFIFQSVALISMMSAYENVEFGLRVAGIKAKERKLRTEECLSLVGLAKRMHHRPQEMSGGEQQRVAIARALANNPKLILADEPTGNLDSDTGKLIVDLLHNLAKSENVTILAVTHDDEIANQTDQTFRFKDGRII